jgi:hypothetical protein
MSLMGAVQCWSDLTEKLVSELWQEYPEVLLLLHTTTSHLSPSLRQRRVR